MAFLMLQQLFRCLHELVAHVALKHPGDEVYLQMALKHVLGLADKVAKNAFEPCKDGSWVYGCVGQMGRRAGGQKGDRHPHVLLCPSYTLLGTVPCISMDAPSHPICGCKSSQKRYKSEAIALYCSQAYCLFSNITPLEGLFLSRPTHLLPHLSLAFPHCSLRAGSQAQQR